MKKNTYTLRRVITYGAGIFGITLCGVVLYVWQGSDTAISPPSQYDARSPEPPASPSITIRDVFERFPLCGVHILRCGSSQDLVRAKPYPPSALDADRVGITDNKVETTIDGPEGGDLNLELVWEGGARATVKVMEWARSLGPRVITGYQLTWSTEDNDWQVTGEELLWIDASGEQDLKGRVVPVNPPIKFLKP